MGMVPQFMFFCFLTENMRLSSPKTGPIYGGSTKNGLITSTGLPHYPW